MLKFNLWFISLALMVASITPAPAAPAEMTPGDRLLAAYLNSQTSEISSACLADIHSLADWQARRPELRRQAAEMLGLDPLPQRTDLQPVITGKLDADTFTVEKLYFQSRPHLYVTANLYLPKNLSNAAPTILYLCGHSPVVTNGISYGNKTAYQHHGIWFARHGYVCLVLDTLQWGEILAHHHGTYSEGAWWWNSRGYTPAGVETWNAIRALDYLASRPEVDAARLGVTGRSGGGAYSWFVAALDDRVKVVAPVAGITDLQNYAVDGTGDNHCDCMFLVNTYRWDYPLLAALCAPRPLLLVNSDADSLFPLDGVLRTHDAIKRIYSLYGATNNFGLVIAPGPHQDIPDVQVPVFHWFNRFLKHADSPIDPAAKMFSAAELKVFDKIPDDQINAVIEQTFVPAAPAPAVPATTEAWSQLKITWMDGLREKCFAGWPKDPSPPAMTRLFSGKAEGILYETYEIQSQTNVALRLYLMRKADNAPPRQIFLEIADSSFTNSLVKPGQQPIEEIRNVFGGTDILKKLATEIKEENIARGVFLPRGIGPTARTGDAKRDTHMRRRFMLLGQTLDSMRVWDIRRAVQALHSLKEFRTAPLQLEAQGTMGINTLYAALFEPGIQDLNLTHLPASHTDGPDYLNVLKILDIPQAAAMAAEGSPARLQFEKPEGLDFLRAMASSTAANLKVELVK